MGRVNDGREQRLTGERSRSLARRSGADMGSVGRRASSIAERRMCELFEDARRDGIVASILFALPDVQ
jgi:hypothetical protein